MRLWPLVTRDPEAVGENPEDLEVPGENQYLIFCRFCRRGVGRRVVVVVVMSCFKHMSTCLEF